MKAMEADYTSCAKMQGEMALMDSAMDKEGLSRFFGVNEVKVIIYMCMWFPFGCCIGFLMLSRSQPSNS